MKAISVNPMSTSSNDESCSEGCIKDTTLFPIFEPPKETMDWFLKVVNNGPDNNYSQTLKSSSWLNDSLKEEVRPLQRHIGNDGSCDATALAIAASKIFVVGRKFFNAYQLKELTCAFSDYWGFSVYMEGSSIKCFYGKPKKKTKCSKVSPSKQRKVSTTVKEINCPFEIKFSRDDRKKEKVHGRIATIVTITQVNLVHCCNPGSDAKALACVKGGKNVLSNDGVKSLLHFTSHGYIHNSSLRNFCRQFLGADVDLSAKTLCNIRKRCVYLAHKFPDFMTHGISNSEIKRLGNDLDCEEEQLFQKLKGVSTTCINIRKQILNDTSSGWKKKKDMNRLYWPYIGPTIVNNENKIGVVVESLCIEESDDTYSFVLALLQDMEPRRKLSSIKVIFVDGFLNDTFATKMNMNSTVMFLDSYHLLNCIWPDSLGERAYNLAKNNLEVMV